MIDVAQFFKSKPVPDWFRNHEIFKEITLINKVFPAIGLANFSIPAKIDTTEHIAPFIKGLGYAMSTCLLNTRYYIETSCIKKTQLMRDTMQLLNDISEQLEESEQLVKTFATKKGLYLHRNILDVKQKIFAKQGESLFKVYNKINDLAVTRHNVNVTVIDSIAEFKNFSAANVTGDLQIVFASDGIEGAWDILTMSMRGISSCQAWNGSYAKCTIGSVVDPYTAIIYLTAGSKTEYGTKMIRRCVVRFAIDPTTRQPCLFLEFMYPSNHPATTKAFIEAIQSKIGNKISIINKAAKRGNSKLFVPYSKTADLLAKYSKVDDINRKGYHNQSGIFPYRDSYMPYRLAVSTKTLNAYASSNFQLRYLSRAQPHFSKILMPWCTNLIPRILKQVLLDKISPSNYVDTGTYHRDLCFHFFRHKAEITRSIRDQIIKEAKKPGCKQLLVESAPIKSVPLKDRPKPHRKQATAKNIDDTLAIHVMPIITSIFKDVWSQTIKARRRRNASSKSRQP